MRLAHRHGRFTAWIAIFAILLAALAPSLARAWPAPPSQAMPWTEICTLAGMSGAHELAPSSGSGQHEAAFPHCPFCLSHGGQLVLPSAPTALLTSIEAGAEFLPASASPPAPRLIGTAAQPRAPPANS